MLGPATIASANGVNLAVGDVLASTGSGTFNHLTNTGTLVDTLNDSTGATFTTGGCFDAAGDFFGTNFASGNISKFDTHANLVAASFVGGMTDPESCTIDKLGNLWVGDAGANVIREFTSSGTAGTLVKSFTVAREDRGTDWVDLSADQCTMLYTSEGSSILSYNVCTNTQNPPFATGLSAPCYANRIRPNGEVLVACTSQVYRLSSTGAILHQYANLGAGALFSLNLDPDGTTFWTGDFNNNTIYRVNIADGTLVTSFSSQPKLQLFGLTVVGEIIVAQACTSLATDTQVPSVAFTRVTAGGVPAVQVDVTDPAPSSGLKDVEASGTNLKVVSSGKDAGSQVALSPAQLLTATLATIGGLPAASPTFTFIAAKIDPNATANVTVQATDCNGHVFDPPFTLKGKGLHGARGADHRGVDVVFDNN